MAGTPQQLKRKREGAEPQRKKAKVQGKAKAVANGEVKAATPVKNKAAIPEANATPKYAAGSESKFKQKQPQNFQGKGTPANPSADTPSSSLKQEKKKLKEDKEKESDEPDVAVVPTEQSDAAHNIGEEASIRTEAPEENQQLVISEDRKLKKKDKRSDPWSLSSPQGGWFLPHDPVFSPDEKHLLLGKLKYLEVYATDTSLLTRALHLGGSGVALAYAISSTNSDLVYVADSSGTITLWNWTNGSKIGRWSIGANVRHLAVVEQPKSSQDLVFTHEEDGQKHFVNVHSLRTGSDASKTELKLLLKTSRPITELQVLLQGKIIVLSTDNSIIIGKRRKFNNWALQDFEYTWREFETSKRITTFSAFVQTSDKDGKKKTQERDHLDLALGDEEGVIYLFEDIITSFAAIEKSQKGESNAKIGPESLTPQRLHWHRTTVGSIKWSLDGNYLISGGDETVLTIWQLSTGKQQHLPHLTAAIESVVVSPSGASYGVTLANNSVIVLSTSELKAKTNIVGIQSRRIGHNKLLHRLSDPHLSPRLFNPVAMEVDPKHINHIALVTPSSQPRHRAANLSEPYIQTFDIANQRPVARQALTRNNATDPNMGPQGRPILEPSVNLLRISHDGAWLATVDEWTPPVADLTYIEEGIPAFNTEERALRREVYLKIWRRDEQNAQWVLDARIDAPHFIEGVSAPARVLDLVADPSGAGFATLGEDRVVRIWRPKTRMRDGVVVRGADAQGLVTWSLDRAIMLADKLDADESNDALQQTTIRTSQLAFSADGSVLAAGVSWVSDVDPGVVHIIDTDNGIIQRSITEIDVTALSGLAIVGRYLVLVGSAVAVWDMIEDQLLYCISNKTLGVRVDTHSQLWRLATNEEDGTFAISAPRLEKKQPDDERLSKVSTRITVFNPNSSEPLWQCRVPDVVLGLVAAKGSRGFIALDTSSNVRIISPTAATLQLPSPPPESTSDFPTESMDVEEEDAEDDEQEEQQTGTDLQLDASEEILQASENDKPVVRPEQLQQIFDSGPSHALPPVRELFDAVVGLYGRKPRVTATGAA